MHDSSHPPFRIGLGYDLHRLAPLNKNSTDQPVRPLVIGGIAIENDAGTIAHSDGDVVLHALTDAILGALAEPDIGQLFPDDKPENAGRESVDFLREALSRMEFAGYTPANADITLIMQKPRIAPYRQAIKRNLANLLRLPEDCVNIKGKTHEHVDAIGEGKAIEAHAAVLLCRVK